MNDTTHPFHKGDRVVHIQDLADYRSDPMAGLPEGSNPPTVGTVVVADDQHPDAPDVGVILVTYRTTVSWVYAEDFTLAPAEIS